MTGEKANPKEPGPQDVGTAPKPKRGTGSNLGTAPSPRSPIGEAVCLLKQREAPATRGQIDDLASIVEKLQANTLPKPPGRPVSSDNALIGRFYDLAESLARDTISDTKALEAHLSGLRTIKRALLEGAAKVRLPDIRSVPADAAKSHEKRERKKGSKLP